MESPQIKKESPNEGTETGVTTNTCISTQVIKKESPNEGTETEDDMDTLRQAKNDKKRIPE